MSAFISAGAFVNLIGNNTPVAPAFSAGQQVGVFTGELLGADTIAAPGAPWIEATANLHAPQLRSFWLNSITGAEAMPTFNWGAVNRGWAIAVVCSGLDPTFTSGFTPLDRVSTQAQNIVGPGSSALPLVDGCMNFFFGTRNKTTTSNGTSYSKPSAFTSLIAQSALNGNVASFALSYWLQTIATTIAANQSMNGTIADGSAQSLQSSLFSIRPAIVAPNALMSWPKQTFVTETLIQI